MSTKKKKSILSFLIQYTIILFLIFLLVEYYLFKIIPYIENYIPSIPQNSTVIINKTIYKSNPIKRWNVVYLENKNNSNQHIIRRVVGLSGETILLQFGEVYIDKNLIQKPSSLQKGLWTSSFDLRKIALEKPNTAKGYFTRFGEKAWSLSVEGILKSVASEVGTIEFSNQIFSKKIKTDICISFNIIFEKDLGRIFLLAKYLGKNIILNLPSTSIGKSPHIQEEMKILKTFTNIQFKPGITYKVELWLYDQQACVFINDKLVFSKNWKIEKDLYHKKLSTNVYLSSQKSKVSISNFKIKRDISFENEGRFGCDPDIPYKIKPDHYFLTTDNVDSAFSDSRSSGSVDGKKYIKGKVIMTLSPNFMEWIY
ncbi:MAG: hypothetical protein COA79_02470 [Planctomycetota bacterium]|nr:MAG: hypothetical protein COA79_02470 [Planctomycetota bacterium]